MENINSMTRTVLCIKCIKYPMAIYYLMEWNNKRLKVESITFSLTCYMYNVHEQHKNHYDAHDYKISVFKKRSHKQR